MIVCIITENSMLKRLSITLILVFSCIMPTSLHPVPSVPRWKKVFWKVAFPLAVAGYMAYESYWGAKTMSQDFYMMPDEREALKKAKEVRKYDISNERDRNEIVNVVTEIEKLNKATLAIVFPSNNNFNSLMWLSRQITSKRPVIDYAQRADTTAALSDIHLYSEYQSKQRILKASLTQTEVDRRSEKPARKFAVLMALTSGALAYGVGSGILKLLK